eukprot:2952554-Pyramimonas_sp.AAC.1
MAQGLQHSSPPYAHRAHLPPCFPMRHPGSADDAPTRKRMTRDPREAAPHRAMRRKAAPHTSTQ